MSERKKMKREVEREREWGLVGWARERERERVVFQCGSFCV